MSAGRSSQLVACFGAQAGLFGWAQAPSRSAIAAARVGFALDAGHPGRQTCRAGLAGEVEQERGEVAQVGEVCRGLDGLSENGHLLPVDSGVDAGLQGENVFAAGCRGDGGEVVLALPGGAGAERVPAHGGRADAAQVGVALVPERSPTGRAPGNEQ